MTIQTSGNCLKCSSEFTYKQVRKPRKYCIPCTTKEPRTYGWQRPYKDCPGCGISFNPGPGSRATYCSNECFNNQRRIQPAICQGCGKEFVPKNTRYSKYCGRACTDASVHQWNAHVFEKMKLISKERQFLKSLAERSSFGRERAQRLEQQKEEAARAAMLVREEILALRRIKDAVRRSIPVVRPCKACGTVITRAFGRGSRSLCDTCRDSSLRACRLANKAKRRGAGGRAIDPLFILVRDNWTCQACLCHTPPRLRGTHADDAPEIDHVVPVSAGGTHEEGNLQTLCRLCNILKSDRSMMDFMQAYLPAFVPLGG